MPLTLPTHPMAVLPLKLWRPRWFDGVALTVGAVAPDVAYALHGLGAPVRTHTLAAVLWWSLPLTLVVSRIIRWAAPAVAAHLPAVLRLPDYGVLGLVRHRWYVTAGSAVAGGFSHLAWDWVTHPGYVPVLRQEVWPGTPWWGLLSDASNVAGFVAAGGLALYLGWSGAVRAWHGAPPAVPVRPVVFWCAVGVTAAGGVGAVVAFPAGWHAAQAVRAMLVCAAALVCGAAVVGWRRSPGRAGRPGGPDGRPNGPGDTRGPTPGPAGGAFERRDHRERAGRRPGSGGD